VTEELGEQEWEKEVVGIAANGGGKRREQKLGRGRCV